MKKIGSIAKNWGPPVVWALVIFIFSSFPTATTSEIYWQDFIVKKMAHMVEYGVFAVLLYRAFKESGVEKKNAGIVAISMAILYGISDEFHQSFTPGRDPRARDVIFDTIGASLAIYLIWNYLPKAPKRLRKWGETLQLL